MAESFYLNGSIKAVTRVFASFVDGIDGASDWKLTWVGSGGDARDALITVELVSNAQVFELLVRTLAKLQGVTYKPGRL